MDNDYIDRRICVEEAAEYLGVSKDTTRNWIMKRTIISTHKIGKQWGGRETSWTRGIKTVIVAFGVMEYLNWYKR